MQDDYGPLIALGRGRDARDALPGFQVLDVDPGTVLMEPGDYDPSLILVARGEVRLALGDLDLGSAGPGELVGEISLFSDHPRTVRAVAATASRLLLIDRDGYRHLRRAGNSVAGGLQRLAVAQMGRNLDMVHVALAPSATGQPPPGRSPHGVFGRLATMMGMAPSVREARRPAARVLAVCGPFADVPEEHVAAIAPHMVHIQATRGAVLCAQAETANRWFMVTEGVVEILVARTPERGAPELVYPAATAGEGAAVGLSAVARNAPHASTAVANTEVWALAMTARSWKELSVSEDPHGYAMRDALLRGMAAQVVSTRQVLCNARRGANLGA